MLADLKVGTTDTGPARIRTSVADLKVGTTNTVPARIRVRGIGT
jgi:hypothetical protein